MQISKILHVWLDSRRRSTASIEKPCQHKEEEPEFVQQRKCTFTFIYGGSLIQRKNVAWLKAHHKISGKWDEWMTLNEMMLCEPCVQNAGTSTQINLGLLNKVENRSWNRAVFRVACNWRAEFTFIYGGGHDPKKRMLEWETTQRWLNYHRLFAGSVDVMGRQNICSGGVQGTEPC